MTAGAWPLVGAEAMRALDRHTIETLGVPGELLMESAGRAVVAEVLAALEQMGAGASVLVVCGSGSNGGDGLVVARHLHVLGVPVRAALLSDAKRLQGDAAANLARARAAGVPIEGPRWRAPCCPSARAAAAAISRVRYGSPGTCSPSNCSRVWLAEDTFSGPARWLGGSAPV